MNLKGGCRGLFEGIRLKRLNKIREKLRTPQYPTEIETWGFESYNYTGVPSHTLCKRIKETSL